MAKKPLVAPTRKAVLLKPVRPNAAIEAKFRARLQAMIEAMNASVLYWVKQQWKAKPPAMAADASPAAELQAEMGKLGSRWEKNFADAAPKLASYFATAAAKRTDAALKKILKDGGFSVEFKMSAGVQDVLSATIGANVELIKSIPSEYLTQVQGAVMRSVQTGRDLGTLTKEIEEQFGVTHRRAAFISRSQNNIATATIQKTRQQELGITHAIWIHSAGGKVPRPEHVAFSGKPYEIAKGAFLEGVWTWPGVEPNCRCVAKAIIPGFD